MSSTSQTINTVSPLQRKSDSLERIVRSLGKVATPLSRTGIYDFSYEELPDDTKDYVLNEMKVIHSSNLIDVLMAMHLISESLYNLAIKDKDIKWDLLRAGFEYARKEVALWHEKALRHPGLEAEDMKPYISAHKNLAKITQFISDNTRRQDILTLTDYIIRCDNEVIETARATNDSLTFAYSSKYTGDNLLKMANLLSGLYVRLLEGGITASIAFEGREVSIGVDVPEPKLAEIENRIKLLYHDAIRNYNNARTIFVNVKPQSNEVIEERIALLTGITEAIMQYQKISGNSRLYMGFLNKVETELEKLKPITSTPK